MTPNCTSHKLVIVIDSLSNLIFHKLGHFQKTNTRLQFMLAPKCSKQDFLTFYVRFMFQNQ